jgi:hypothetical protein
MENQNYVPNQEFAKQQSVVSIWDWIITFILMVIPIVNFVMIFVWAFGGGCSASKANWAKAILIFWVIGIILAIFFWGVVAALFASVFSGFR